MHERQYTRIDHVRKYLDDMLKNCADKEVSRNGYVHLYGVGQACALIALYRGHDRAYAELAEVAGMLHDYAKYKDDVEEHHAEKSSVEARQVLLKTNRFTPEEIDMVCQAIYRHSNKTQVDTEFDEILKDADEMQHWLRNPAEEYFFRKERTQKIAKEFGLLKCSVSKEDEVSMLHMIVEQTYNYPMRMEYHPDSNSFSQTEYKSLHYERGFTKPYGWIKESGTPPQPHWDCLLMTDKDYELGDEVAVNIIGLFKRSDLDHKYVAVEVSREINDISELPEEEKEELKRLYPRIREGEGWFGREEAAYCMEHHEKAL